MEFFLFIALITSIITIIIQYIKRQDTKDEVTKLMAANRNLVFQLDEKEKEYKIKIKELEENLKNKVSYNYKSNEKTVNIDTFNILQRDCDIKNKIIEEKQNIINSITSEINLLKKENLNVNKDKLEKSINKLEKKKTELKEEISELKKEIKSLKSDDLSLYTEKIVFDTFESFSSNELKDKLSLLKLEQKQLVQDDKAIKSIEANYTDRSVERNNRKQLLSCFEAECNNAFQNLKFSNIDKTRDKIIKVFNNLNNIVKTDDINLSSKFSDLKLKELNFLIEITEKQQEEKETQKANNDIEKQIYADKIKELEEKIKLLEKDKENVLQRETNTRAGFVYIISSIGSSGENVFKIGMTRRLEPMDRISELSSASVPFPFDIHALIFSDDAPSLENSLHKYF